LNSFTFLAVSAEEESELNLYLLSSKPEDTMPTVGDDPTNRWCRGRGRLPVPYRSTLGAP
jgi:hypothetical protein